jgi:predicted nucleic acid-binding protein
MYYIDTNILIYANAGESPYHKSASEILFKILHQSEAVIHEIILAEFFAVITDARKMEFPWSNSQAKEYIITLLDAVQELHFLNFDIVSAALEDIEKHSIQRYNIYDHLLAYSMKFYGVDKIVTLNKQDFEKYDFIKEIVIP